MFVRCISSFLFYGLLTSTETVNHGCRQTINDLTYSGIINVTRNGYVCKPWKNGGYYLSEDENYCRTPDNDRDNGGGPWCYVNGLDGKHWDRCNVPVCNGNFCPELSDENLLTLDQKTRYQYGESIILECKPSFQLIGQKYLTCNKNGHWNESEPTCQEQVGDNCIYKTDTKGLQYRGTVNITENNTPCLPWSGSSKFPSLTSNYCRNPDSSDRPWCYVIYPKTGDDDGWTYCNISICLMKCSHLVLNEGNNMTPSSPTYNQNVTLSCKPGYTGSPIITRCNTDGSWPPQRPRCSRRTCSHLVLNEGNNMTPSSPTYNQNVTLSCKPGYTGSPIITRCSTDGSWPPQRPHCSRRTCSHLVLNEGNNMTPSSPTYNQNVTLSCKPGYTGSPIITRCSTDGSWPPQRPHCSRRTCSHLVLNEGNNMTPSSPTYNQNVTLSCKPGYTGSPIITRCSTDGSWPPQRPQCSQIKCSWRSNYPFVTVKPKKTIYNYHDNVTASCIPGYNGISVIRMCSKNSSWLGSNPNCSPIKCLPISATNEIMMSQPSPNYSQEVTLSCKPGYTGKNITSRCYSDGSWPPQRPNCLPVACLSLPITEEVLITSSGSEFTFNQNVTLSCQPGYKGRSIVIGCSTRGVWPTDRPNCTQTSEASGQSRNIGGAVGGGVTSAVVIIIIVVVTVTFIKRRQNQNKGDEAVRYKQTTESREEQNVYSEIRKSGMVFIEDRSVSINMASKDGTYNNEPEGGYYDFSEGLQMSKTAIPVREFYEYVENGRGKGGKLETEFLDLKSGLQNSTDAALKPGNKSRNKYKNLYAYDETRVKLETSPQFTSDYINASYINGYGRLKQYVASQGPQDNTVNEFWRMVFQIDCGKIVMLTNVYEEAKKKCNHYWPDAVGKSDTFDCIVVTLLKEDIYSDFSIRHITIQKENLKKKVIQFHFTAWPDKDVPKYSSSLVHFRHKVNSTDVSRKGPTIVHCSAGIGRTGTYIALDFAVNEAKEVDNVDVFRCVETLRRQRVNMVQTSHQYVFLHDAILEALMCLNSGIPSKDFPDVYKDLMTFDSVKKKHKLHVEYDLLNFLSQKHDEDAFEKGKRADNKSKNRYSNIIPVGSEMPRLTSAVEGHNEYINAVFLPGYKSSRAFIITQMPMENTVVDFWRLIYDYKISVIVMLNTEFGNTDVYLPKEKGELLATGPFQIEQRKIVRKTLYSVIEVFLTSKDEQRRVNVFQQTFWKDGNTIPDDTESFFTFIADVEEDHGKECRKSPLLVHCLNGCDKSGLFCVMATVIGRLRIEQDVDIQHIIKQMRNRRPQIIPTYDQFRFLYEAVIDYLKQFETYANFI